MSPPLQSAERLSLAEEEPNACQPLISEDLKGRLETLVLQVKSTLSRTHSGQVMETSSSEGQPLQVALAGGGGGGAAAAAAGGHVASNASSLSPKRVDVTRKHRRVTAEACCSPAPAMVPDSPGRAQSQLQVPHQVLRSVSISSPRRALRSQSPVRHSGGSSAVLAATPHTARSLAASSPAFSVVGPQQLWIEGCATSPVPVPSQQRKGSWYGR